MSNPPSVDYPVVTIDDAELAGWSCLSVRCGCATSYFPWPSLRHRSRYRRLDDIIPRLRCSKCGRHVEKASLHWMGGWGNKEVRDKVIFGTETVALK